MENIFIKGTPESVPYRSVKLGRSTEFPVRSDPRGHARYVETRLHAAYERSDTQKKAAAIRYKDGMYIQFQSKAGFSLKLDSLENRAQGIRLLNVKQQGNSEENSIQLATVYVPGGKEHYFLSRISDFLDKKTSTGKPKNSDLVSSIEDVSLAVVDAFWTSTDYPLPAEGTSWCEVWIRFAAGRTEEETKENQRESLTKFVSTCKEIGIKVDLKIIAFPERIVKLVRATRNQLSFLINMTDVIAEFRHAPIDLDLTQLNGPEQQEWVDDLLERTTYHAGNVAVCLLDTGLAGKHPLIENALAGGNSIQAVEPTWSPQDVQGHGTEMAGVVLYDDLRKIIADANTIVIGHTVESVKILPDKGINRPELYGDITSAAVSLAEINAPLTNRVICMAITANDSDMKDGSPSSWSAAIDQITSGALEEDDIHRLFLVSAGNVTEDEVQANSYPDASILHSVEDPGQSWNALTVGAFNDDIQINDRDFSGFHPVAERGELSPFSSTSVGWGKGWPVKPEIVLNGGNMVRSETDTTTDPELALLTTNRNFAMSPLTTIWGTSAATAQAGWMAAKIIETYPDLWPETVRALIVHSARWTEKMKACFNVDNKKTMGIHQLLRTCGYGIPSLDRAIESKANSVNLVVQGSLQPFEEEAMNEMQFYKIPWPAEVLTQLGEVPATLRVTLSYFIEPGPGRIGWNNRYRYSSAGLRFDVKNSNESVTDFQKRVNGKMREDKKDSGEGSGRNWLLGPANRDVGSIHSDFCTTAAIDLVDANYIAVYPVIGWWRQRKYLGKSNNKLRYSLVVSIETPATKADLYSAIQAEISQSTKTIISIENQGSINNASDNED